MIYRKFKLNDRDYLKLSKEDLKVLAILEGVVKDIGEVYKLQLEDGFYPQNVTKAQLEKAREEYHGIFSPFTYVEKVDGKFKAVPYHIKYSEYLKPIAQKIDEAAKVTTNKSFSHYLKLRAKSLLNGKYKEADIAWFGVKGSVIDFSVGPFERYLDKMFFVKRAFQAHVGVIDDELTKTAEEIKETLYSSAKVSLDKQHSTSIPKKGVHVFVENTPATAGYIADVVFSGEHFPSDLDVMQQHGSKILIYESQLRLKFEKLHYPIFKAIFEKRFASKYPKNLLLKAIGWNILLYELSRQLHKFTGARERLKELYGPIDEANTVVSGIQHAKYLVMKGLISQDELEAIIIIHIVRMFSDWLLYQQNERIENHVRGSSIALNSYLSIGALKELNGISWPNFPKIFFEIEMVANTLVALLQKGSYDEANTFIKKNVNLQSFERLGKPIKNLKVNI